MCHSRLLKKRSDWIMLLARTAGKAYGAAALLTFHRRDAPLPLAWRAMHHI